MSKPKGHAPAVVIISDNDRESPESLVRKSTATQAQVLRTKIALGCKDGKTNGQIASEVGTAEKTVCKWRLRFSKYGVGTLSDAPRSRAPRTITDEMVMKIIETTLDETPDHETHWSTYSLAEKLDMSQNAIFRIWKILS